MLVVCSCARYLVVVCTGVWYLVYLDHRTTARDLRSRPKYIELTGRPWTSSAEIVYHSPLNYCWRSSMFKNVVNRCQSLAEMPNERNRVRKGDSPKRIPVHRKRGRVCRCITANTCAICVADTIVRVNRCTPVIVAALIDYWLRTNDE